MTRLVSPLDACRRLIGDDMARMRALLEKTLDAQKEYLTDNEYELYRRGKKLRPLMLLLSARLAGEYGGDPLPEKVISAAVSLEMLHVATLIHDDIVDKAPLRRGLRSVHAERGTDIAILIGDMQFIQAIRCFADQVQTQEEIRLVQLVLDVGFKICCGELDELRTDPTWSTDVLRERYLTTVDHKTAAMFGAACECGASLSGAGNRAVFYVSQFGRRFGQAFQMMDDIFDFVTDETVSGKKAGTDLVQGRLSLPIINVLDELDRNHPVWRILLGQPHTDADLEIAIDAVVTSGGFVAVYSKARELICESIRFLDNFPKGPYRDALVAIAEFVVNRGFATSNPRL